MFDEKILAGLKGLEALMVHEVLGAIDPDQYGETEEDWQRLVDDVTRHLSSKLRAIGYSDQDQIRILRVLFSDAPYVVNFSLIESDPKKLH